MKLKAPTSITLFPRAPRLTPSEGEHRRSVAVIAADPLTGHPSDDDAETALSPCTRESLGTVEAGQIVRLIGVVAENEAPARHESWRQLRVALKKEAVAGYFDECSRKAPVRKAHEIGKTGIEGRLATAQDKELWSDAVGPQPQLAVSLLDGDDSRMRMICQVAATLTREVAGVAGVHLELAYGKHESKDSTTMIIDGICPGADAARP